MKKAIAIFTALLILIQSGWYSWQIWHHEIHPVLATWTIFGVGVSLSWWTYWSSRQHRVISNVANAADLVGVGMILLAMLFSGEAARRWFNGFEMCCLLGAGIILVFWRMSRRHETANALLQVLMTVAYFPTIYGLWHATRSTEPLGTWIITWAAALGGTVAGALGKDRLGVLYAGRALVLITVVLVLIVRVQAR